MSENIKWLIKPQDIDWEMDWSRVNADGTRLHPDKPEKEMVFEGEHALAHLLINEVIFLNSHHWMDSWPKGAQDTTALCVNCGDVFAWGCADAENALYHEIESLYRMWIKDPTWGAAMWCIIKRKELPQGPVAKYIREGGIWDLDALTKEHSLKPNFYDGVSSVRSQHQYRVYSEWEKSEGREPKPFDVGWWEGWRAYIVTHPDWYSEEWKAEDEQLKQEWMKANGYNL